MVGRLSVCLLLITIGFAGTAQAQPSDADPVDQPRPLLSATATCHTDTAEVQVIVHDDRDAPFTLHLTGPRFSDKRTTILDTKHFVHVADFPGLAAGEYDITTETFDSPADGVHLKVQDCAPSKDPLSVELECKAGWGTATFQVANPNADKQIRYTLTIDGLPAHIISLNPNTFVRITENGYEDRRHTAVLSGENVTRTFTVACQFGNPPTLDLTTSACDGTKAQLTATLLNPNGLPVTYTVELDGTKKTVKLGGGEHNALTFPGLESGDHKVTVTGSDKTTKSATATVNCGTVTTTTTTSASTTTTAAPVPQGRSGGGLASTGVVVTGLLGLALVALGLGGTLLITARRRARHN